LKFHNFIMVTCSSWFRGCSKPGKSTAAEVGKGNASSACSTTESWKAAHSTHHITHRWHPTHPTHRWHPATHPTAHHATHPRHSTHHATHSTQHATATTATATATAAAHHGAGGSGCSDHAQQGHQVRKARRRHFAVLLACLTIQRRCVGIYIAKTFILLQTAKDEGSSVDIFADVFNSRTLLL
jgi:hypothetical protein